MHEKKLRNFRIFAARDLFPESRRIGPRDHDDRCCFSATRRRVDAGKPEAQIMPQSPSRITWDARQLPT
jgi:hypothetical protein